jgi:hypothetical protein
MVAHRNYSSLATLVSFGCSPVESTVDKEKQMRSRDYEFSADYESQAARLAERSAQSQAARSHTLLAEFFSRDHGPWMSTRWSAHVGARVNSAVSEERRPQ